MRRPLALAAIVLGLLILGAGLVPGAALARPRATATRALTVTVSGVPVSRPLPADFLGFALEYPTIPAWVDDLGLAPGVDPVLLQLIHNLDPTGRPVLRIGGQSGDRAWWPVPEMTAPVGVTDALGPSWTQAARALAVALDARYLLGINLEAESTVVSGVEARNLVAGVGRPYVEALELGNEPDLYRRTPWYWLRDGRQAPWFERVGTPVFSRSVGFGDAEYVAEVERSEAVLPAGIPIAGPDAANARWIGGFSALAQQPDRVALLDSHSYALQSCQRDPSSPRYPTIPNLLALRASRDVLHNAAPYVTLAHREHLPFRIDEMGSVTCNGRAGVSDTMAAGLWVTDALFAAVSGGVDGVNLHSYPGSTNGLFDLAYADGAWSATVHPIYDGAMMFAEADPTGARLLAVKAGDTSQVRSWATMGADGRMRVMLIDVGGARTVTVRPPSDLGGQPAGVVQMLAPSVAATSGVTIGGQSFGAAGTLAPPAPDALAPRAGAYTVTLPADSETLLTLDPRSRRPSPAPADARARGATTLRGGAGSPR